MTATETQTKVCSKCGEDKGVGEFRKMSKGKYGVGRQCKICIRVCNKEYVKKNIDKIIEKRKINSIKNNERSKNWNLNNRKKYNQNSLKWQKNNPEKVRKRDLKWKKANPEKVKEKAKKARCKIKELRPCYLKKRLREKGILNPTPDLLEIQKLTIKIKRLCKEVTQ